MKLFIITLNNKEGHPEEYLSYSRSLAELAITLNNIGMSARAIEEIPNDPKVAAETGISWIIPYADLVNCPASF